LANEADEALFDKIQSAQHLVQRLLLAKPR